MLSGESVFLTGAPGAGKTFVLNQFIDRAIKRGKRVAVTASTGIAATHIGGTTIHSWSGLGIKDSLNELDITRLTSNNRLIKRYNGTDILVIDEISMLHGSRLDMVNQACKLLRENPEPFGGLQVVLVGDLFQLPPVQRGSEAADFVHQSAAWQELNQKICYITEQHRQTEPGDSLLNLLEAMRRGGDLDEYEEILRARLEAAPPDGAAITRLYSHNIDVDSINERQLRQLSGNKRVYRMTTSGSARRAEQLTQSLLAPAELTLAEGVEVMFVVNDLGAGFSNGTRGQVIGFEADKPLVRLLSGRQIAVEPHEWKLTIDGRTVATATQLPLRLAWAITIHKSQGMSLDAAIIDLSRSFAPGMGYVALSRVRSVGGIYLLGINNGALQLIPDMYEFDRELRRQSESLAIITPDAAKEDESPQSQVPEIDQLLLQKLKDWRRIRAAAENIPAYIVAHDKTLERVAAHRPHTLAALRAIPGFGPKKTADYGREILQVVASAG